MDSKTVACFFCGVSADKIIAENHLAYALRDNYPLTRLHTLIMPKRHVPGYFDLSPEEKRALEVKLRALYNEIPPEMRVRYGKVDTLCGSIRGNYRRLPSTTQIFAKETEDRLDGLLQGYLRLLHALQQHYEYLRNTDVERIKKEAAELQRTMAADPPKVQEINRKRIEILGKRIEKFGKIRENCSVIEAQCGAMEDVLQLIRDQSVTLRDPQQVNDQLEGLVHDVERTEQTVHEVQAVFDLATPDTFGTSVSDSGSTIRPGNRMRN